MRLVLKSQIHVHHERVRIRRILIAYFSVDAPGQSVYLEYPYLNWRAGMKKPAGLRRRASDCRQRCAWSSHRQAAPLYIKKIAAMTTRPDRPQMILITNRKCIAKPPLQKNHRDGDRRD
jgi:hypothetical protein